MIDEKRLNEIEQRHKAATMGTWRTEGPTTGEYDSVWTVEGNPVVHDVIGDGNAKFISEAHQDIPDLVAEVRSLQNALRMIDGYIAGILRPSGEKKYWQRFTNADYTSYRIRIKWRCPVCESELMYAADNCPHCGQRLY